MSQVFTEPHSTKQREDGAWALRHSWIMTENPARPALPGPVLIVHGDQDAVVPSETGAALAQWTGGQMVTIRGGGHAPTMRDPVQANLLIRGFAESLGPSAPTLRTWTRSLAVVSGCSTSPRPSATPPTWCRTPITGVCC